MVFMLAHIIILAYAVVLVLLAGASVLLWRSHRDAGLLWCMRRHHETSRPWVVCATCGKPIRPGLQGWTHVTGGGTGCEFRTAVPAHPGKR
jgi:hypothetical protein